VSTILVADDNTNIQKMVSLAFEERGIRVVAVGNGEAAVRRMPDVRPDVVLADVFMPVRSGYEVCEFVKKDSRFAQTPVILLVGAFDPLDEKEARRVGADGVLKKPFVPPDPLIAMVTSLLNKAAKPTPTPQADAPALQAVPPSGPRPVPQPETVPEPEPDEIAVTRGPFSLRDEDGPPPLEGLGASGAHGDAGNPWDEPENEWQRRRAQMEYDIPEAGSGEKPDAHTVSPFTLPHEAEAQSPEDFVAEEPPQVSVEPGTLAELAANPAEWMEMMSAPLSAETSKAAPQWQSPTPSHEPAITSKQDSNPAPTDASASEESGDWRQTPSISQAPLEPPAPPQANDLQAEIPGAAARTTPSETTSAEASLTPVWPASFEAEYGISPETLLGSETSEGWHAAPEAPNAGPSAEAEHAEPAASAEPQHNAPVEQPQDATEESAIESAPRAEYELLVAPAAAIPIHQTAEPSAATWQSGGPSAPRDLEEESTPEESSASSSYASYLPAAFSSDVIPTSNETESEPAPAEPAAEEAARLTVASPLDPAVVDALVAKVLERLRPELQELLSDKVVRPLVESALEHEISKK
jgi:CheY-like chemotaxis protein